MIDYRVLQIWIESPDAPSEDELSYMRTVIDNRPKGSTYWLVSTTNYFKKEDIEWIDVNEIISDMFDDYLDVKKFWFRLNVYHRSDFIRYYLASKEANKDLIYFDCDSELKSWTDAIITNGTPVFCNRARSGRAIDGNLFCVNGNTEWFVKLMEHLIQDFKSARRIIPYSRVYNTLNRFVKDYAVASIDDHFMVHHNEKSK